MNNLVILSLIDGWQKNGIDDEEFEYMMIELRRRRDLESFHSHSLMFVVLGNNEPKIRSNPIMFKIQGIE